MYEILSWKNINSRICIFVPVKILILNVVYQNQSKIIMKLDILFLFFLSKKKDLDFSSVVVVALIHKYFKLFI
jgi:hypothetical protein